MHVWLKKYYYMFFHKVRKKFTKSYELYKYIYDDKVFYEYRPVMIKFARRKWTYCHLYDTYTYLNF